MSAQEPDRIALPPAREVIVSSGGAYELVIAMQGEPGEWASSGSEGELFQATGEGPRSVWKSQLPHAYRPRFALVSDAGSVVLLDQWINVLGPHAVTVIDPAGQTVARYGFDEVATALGVSHAHLVKQARHGSWMSSLPMIDTAGNSVRVDAGGRTLVIGLRDGVLTPDG